MCAGILVALVVIAMMPGAAQAACANPVACENALTGDPPSDWQVNGVGDASIQGYGTSMSVNVGQTVNFKINTPSTAYHIDILRLGYYQGNGARKIASRLTPSTALPQTQPACMTDSSTGLIDCGNWGVSASWTVPSTAVSGIYIAHLVRDDPQDPGGSSQIVFVVRNDASHSNVLLQTSDATWEAYNSYGGNSLYRCTVACPAGNPLAYKAAYKVSYNRPFDGGSLDGGASWLYYAEYQQVRFLEANGYDVSYTSESDVDNNGALLRNHKVFVSSGHDEYWSAGARANVTGARDAGVNLAFFSGNEMFWKTRWESSIDGSNVPYRTLVSYKETHFNAPVDPQDPPTSTGTWRDPRFSPSADGGVPENALTGQFFLVNSGTSDIVVPAAYAKLRLWRNTAVASLSSGQSLVLGKGTGTLGYEWDVDADNGFRPPGLFDLSSTTVAGVETFTDYGSTTAPNQTATHHLTMYRAPSGALVFGAGTVQWSWGLDNTNAWANSNTDPSRNPPDRNMQQATVNLFADMGVQPGTLISGLTAATQSTLTPAPTSNITSPAAGASSNDGSALTISGTATAGTGAVVAGVEVSTDGGKTWHPAALTTAAGASVSWSYQWVAQGNPSTTIKSRATDDAGSIESPSASVSVNVSCPCSLWGAGTPGGAADSGDSNAVSVGMKFSSDRYGTVSALRFYKVAANTGTHVGSLWDASGHLLASATFTNETTSGWQQVKLSNPVTIWPNTTYVISYYAPNGHYASSNGYFYRAPSPAPVGGGSSDNSPLHAITNGTSPNGLFLYGANAFPTGSYQASNYWVDPVFTIAPAPGQATGVSATAGTASATVNWSAPTSGGAATTYTITPYIGSTTQPSTTVTGSPAATTATVRNLSAASYTFTVTASNPNGSGPASSQSPAITPAPATAPSAVTNVDAKPATSSALVAWTLPASDGGSAITGYTVTPYVGLTAQAAVYVTDPSATSATVKGLTNGTAYTFAVTAANAIGTSPESASSAVTPGDTIFDFATPPTVDGGDASALTVGVKFTADVPGYVTGVRFYKAQANTGTHIGSLWDASGNLLASATFAGESASGWQAVRFSAPVAITAGSTYVASYFAPSGHYSVSSGAFAAAVDSPPLHALADSTSSNGVFAYGSASTFPTGSFNASNYWVDVTITTAGIAPNQPSLSTLPGFIYNGQSLTASGVSENIGGAGVARVNYYSCAGTACTPTTLIGSSSDASGNYAVSWNHQPADGTDTVMAQTQDNAGNMTNSVTQTTTIDNTPPAVTTAIADPNANEAGYINGAGSYYVYANVIDAGSGVNANTITANVSNQSAACTPSCVSQPLTSTGGPWTVLNPNGTTTSYGYRSAQLTATTTPASGYSVTASDNVTNAVTQTSSVTIDAAGNPPSPSAGSLVTGVTQTSATACTTTTNGYVNAATQSSETISTNVGTGSTAGDVIRITATDGTKTLTFRKVVSFAGAGKVSLGGLDLSSLSDASTFGTKNVTLTASEYTAGGNGVANSLTTTVSKATVAPSVTTSLFAYVDNAGTTADQVSGASGAAARSGYVTFMETAPRRGASFVYRTSTGTTGGFARFNLDATAGRAGKPVSATYNVTTVDGACNQTARPATYTVADSR